MTLGMKLLIPVAVVGATATILAAGLFWTLITRPLAAAQILGGF